MRSFWFPVKLMRRPPKLMNTELTYFKLSLSLHLLVLESILEDLALHHVLILVKERPVAVVSSSPSTLVVIAEDVKVLTAVLID